MTTLEIELTDPHQLDRPPIVDWVKDYDLADTKRQAEAAGFRVRVLGAVSWQRQLAHMENNPDCL